MTAKIFIDGEAGTTGLEIRERLAHVPGVSVLSIAPDKRKDTGARRELMAAADLVVLCLPDDAAKDAVALANQLGDKAPKIVDASTAHRIAPGWVYGFAELNHGQGDAIRTAKKVANPGCYPTGAIALIRPLIDAGLMAPEFPVSVNAVSGYSGGGRSMIESYEAGIAPSFELYALGLEHKHVPELMKYAGLTTRPIFVPSIGNFRQGMLVSVPLHLSQLPGQPSAKDLERALEQHYQGAATVRVMRETDAGITRLEAESLNGTDALELYVVSHAKAGHAVLVAKLDNLGKGAAGAAVQNIKLMLGLGSFRS